MQSSKINKILGVMHSQARSSDKGSYGEDAAFMVCEEIYQKYGGILIHSYEYTTEPGLPGNIKRNGSGHYVERLGGYTEIDVLLVTPFRVFPIEVKAYRANTITIYNEGMSGAAHNDKSPVHQNEMHCRHLYPKIFAGLPSGHSNFICPIVVFVDKTKVVDKRSDDQKMYIKVTILNQLKAVLENNCIPIDNTILDVPVIERKLRQAMVGNKKFLPYLSR